MLVIPEARQMWGIELYLSGCYLGAGEYLILVSANYLRISVQGEHRFRRNVNGDFGSL